jgi:hypothetical protein
VYVYEGHAAGGRVRVSLRVRDGVIDGVAARGAVAVPGGALLGRPLAAPAAGLAAPNPADLVGDLLAAPVAPTPGPLGRRRP